MPWYLPILIFLMRICDVSVGTIRIITVTRGHKLLSAALGFIEVTVWLFAVAGVMMYIRESFITVFAYSAGFAAGVLVGMLIEERLAMGSQMIRVVHLLREPSLASMLRERGMTVTQVPARSGRGEAELCFFATRRRQTPEVVRMVLEHFPDAYITVEDLRSAPVGSDLYSDVRSRLPGWRRLIKFK
jgi:uncharacterized protein YebE (UPF0316 family)